MLRILLALSITLSGTVMAQEDATDTPKPPKPPKLFEDDSIMAVTLTGPWRKLVRDKSSEERHEGSLTYTDASGREPVHMYFLWVAYRGRLYQFIGLGPERYRPLLRDTALSFRPLTSNERASIRETRLRIVPAKAGESLSELSARTGNELDVALTAVVNGIDPNNPLTGGQLVKIAVSQPYKNSRRNGS